MKSGVNRRGNKNGDFDPNVRGRRHLGVCFIRAAGPRDSAVAGCFPPPHPSDDEPLPLLSPFGALLLAVGLASQQQQQQISSPRTSNSSGQGLDLSSNGAQANWSPPLLLRKRSSPEKLASASSRALPSRSRGRSLAQPSREGWGRANWASRRAAPCVFVTRRGDRRSRAEQADASCSH